MKSDSTDQSPPHPSSPLSPLSPLSQALNLDGILERRYMQRLYSPKSINGKNLESHSARLTTRVG